MPRIARVIAPNAPHHITQRGNRRQATFFHDDDYRLYLSLMAKFCGKHNVQIWAYCLMPNHVHLIAVPHEEEGLTRAIGEAHRRYTRQINFQKGWRGHLWQGRFASYPMDNSHLLSAARYIEMNPVRAGLVNSPGAYSWSSAKAHLTGRDDDLVKVRPMLEMVKDWRGFLDDAMALREVEVLRRHERTGRPLGDDRFLTKLERVLDRPLKKGKPGPKGEKRR